MRRIYLDQNKWIDLSRAAQGREDGRRYIDVLEVARYGVEQGLASFPLSAAHYMETLRRRDSPSRHRLAMIMCELSRFHTMAPATAILPAELDDALRTRFGKPANPRPLRVFGVGVRHAFGLPPERYRAPKDARLTSLERYDFEERATELVERAVLAGPDEGIPVPGMQENEYFRGFGERQARAEMLLSQKLREYEAPKENSADWLAGLAIADIVEPLNEALQLAGLSGSECPGLDTADGLTNLLQDLPSQAVPYELRRLRHENPNTNWEQGDLEDVSALSLAIPYCDVVVTEKQWSHLGQGAGLDVRFGSTILYDLARLPEAILSH